MFDWLRGAGRSASQPITERMTIDSSLFEGPAPALYQALAGHWSSSDASMATAPDASLWIDALERRYAVRIPEDFKQYLLHASPRETYWDDIGTQWWPAHAIKNIPDECPDGPPGGINPAIESERDKYLIFADYLIWCYAWAICCSEGENRGKIALIGGIPDIFVASDFREFLKLELDDAPRIHGATGGAESGSSKAGRR